MRGSRSKGIFWQNLQTSAYVGIGFSLLFNIETVEMLFVSDGHLEWPHTLHVWVIQATALIASVVSLIAYSKRDRIKIWLKETQPASQSGVLLVALIIIEFFLGVAFWFSVKHPGFSDWGYLDGVFHLNGEFNVPALFSVAQFWFAGALAFLCLRLSRVVGDYSQQNAIAWVSCGAILVLLGMDELLSFHEDAELLLVALGILDDNYDNRLGGFGYSWTLVGLPLALVFGMWFFWRFYQVFRNEKRYLLILVVAALVFLVGSVFMENLQVYVVDHYQLQRSPTVLLLAEEMLEMLGVSLAIYVFFRYYRELGRLISNKPFHSMPDRVASVY